MTRLSWKVLLSEGYTEWWRRSKFSISGKSMLCKLREVSGILTRKDLPLKLKVYVICVWGPMKYGSESCAMNAEQIRLFKQTEMRIL